MSEIPWAEAQQIADSLTPEQRRAIKHALLVQEYPRALTRPHSPPTFPPVWHPMNPLSPAVWITGHAVASLGLLKAILIADPSTRGTLGLCVLFGVASVVFCVVVAMQRPIRVKQYGSSPDLRAAWRAGWRWPRSSTDVELPP